MEICVARAQSTRVPDDKRWRLVPHLAAMWFETEVVGSKLAGGLDLEAALKGWGNYLETLADRGIFPVCFKNSLVTHLNYEQRRAQEVRDRVDERLRQLEKVAARRDGEIFQQGGHHFKLWHGMAYPAEASYAAVVQFQSEYGLPVPTRDEFDAMCRAEALVCVD